MKINPICTTSSTKHIFSDFSISLCTQKSSYRYLVGLPPSITCRIQDHRQEVVCETMVCFASEPFPQCLETLHVKTQIKDQHQCSTPRWIKLKMLVIGKQNPGRKRIANLITWILAQDISQILGL